MSIVVGTNRSNICSAEFDPEYLHDKQRKLWPEVVVADSLDPIAIPTDFVCPATAHGDRGFTPVPEYLLAQQREVEAYSSRVLKSFTTFFTVGAIGGVVNSVRSNCYRLIRSSNELYFLSEHLHRNAHLISLFAAGGAGLSAASAVWGGSVAATVCAVIGTGVSVSTVAYRLETNPKFAAFAGLTASTAAIFSAIAGLASHAASPVATAGVYIVTATFSQARVIRASDVVNLGAAAAAGSGIVAGTAIAACLKKSNIYILLKLLKFMDSLQGSGGPSVARVTRGKGDPKGKRAAADLSVPSRNVLFSGGGSAEGVVRFLSTNKGGQGTTLAQVASTRIQTPREIEEAKMLAAFNDLHMRLNPDNPMERLHEREGFWQIVKNPDFFRYFNEDFPRDQPSPTRDVLIGWLRDEGNAIRFGGENNPRTASQVCDLLSKYLALSDEMRSKIGR